LAVNQYVIAGGSFNIVAFIALRSWTSRIAFTVVQFRKTEDAIIIKE